MAGLLAFNDCIALANSGIRITSQITHPFLIVQVALNGTGVHVQGVNASPNLVCTSTSFGSGHQLTPLTSTNISSNFNINCQRKTEPRRNADGTTSNVAPSASFTLSLSAAGANYTIEIPDDELEDYVKGRQNRDTIATLVASQQATQAALDSANAQLKVAKGAVADERDRIAKEIVKSQGVYYSGGDIPFLQAGFAAAGSPFVRIHGAHDPNIDNSMHQVAASICQSKFSNAGTTISQSDLSGIFQASGGCCGIGGRALGCANVRDEAPATKAFGDSGLVPISADSKLIATVMHEFLIPTKTAK